MKVIYKPNGRAGEYADLALNLYNGCPAGCLYCYVPLVLRKDRMDFHANCESRATLKAKMLQDIEDLAASATHPPPIFLCFTCDPYPIPDSQFTREILSLLVGYNLNFTVLTKFPTRAIRDFNLYRYGDSYGVTLVAHGPNKDIMEPGSDSIDARICSLALAHDLGISTWCSIEPVIFPGEALDLIDATTFCTDVYKIGPPNRQTTLPDYCPRPSPDQYRLFLRRVTRLITETGRQYLIKTDFRPFLDKDIPYDTRKTA